MTDPRYWGTIRQKNIVILSVSMFNLGNDNHILALPFRCLMILFDIVTFEESNLAGVTCDSIFLIATTFGLQFVIHASWCRRDLNCLKVASEGSALSLLMDFACAMIDVVLLSSISIPAN